MAQGLILLGFLAVLVTVFAVRMRRRLGLRSTARHWSIVFVGFVIAVLSLWAASRR